MTLNCAAHISVGFVCLRRSPSESGDDRRSLSRFVLLSALRKWSLQKEISGQAD